MATKAITNKQLEARIDELEAKLSEMTEKLTIVERASVTDNKTPPVKKDKDAPKVNKDGTLRKKRATCGYMIFSNEKRAETRTALLEEAGEDKLAPGAVVKELGRLWKELEESEREEYNQQAKDKDSSASSSDVEVN